MPRTPKEYQTFTSLVDRLLSVSRETVQQRLAAHKEQADKNPRKRGPKPKRVTASASDDDPAAE